MRMHRFVEWTTRNNTERNENLPGNQVRRKEKKKRQLTKRFREISAEVRSQISGLPLPVLEDLSEALLDFTSLADLQSWLAALGS